MMMLTIVASTGVKEKNKRRIIFMNSPTVTRGVRKTLNLLSKSQKKSSAFTTTTRIKQRILVGLLSDDSALQTDS